MSPLGADTFNVTRFDDPAPDACLPADCSLREAVMAANATSFSVINLAAGTYTLTIPGNDEGSPNEAVGDLDIRGPMRIFGAGAASTIVQAGLSPGLGIHRIFDNHSAQFGAGEVYLVSMTLRTGMDVEATTGGCLRNLGVLRLDSVVVTGCRSAVGGGGVASYHHLIMVDSTITANTVLSTTGASVKGGGVLSGPGTVAAGSSLVHAFRSVISNNTVTSAGNVDGTAVGGGFANDAQMYIEGGTVSGNSALNAGGGITVGGMTIRRSRVTGNTARFDAGGIHNHAGQLYVQYSTIDANVAGFNCVGGECTRASAGGILNSGVGRGDQFDGALFVETSTLHGNSCLVSGGGLQSTFGTVNVGSSTVTGNTCGLGAGVAASAVVILKNTILADNTATDPTGGDCSGTVTSAGYNLIRNGTGCTVAGDLTGNVTGLDPSLGPLQDNGGPTPTRALLVGSPAFNAANPNPDGCWITSTPTGLTDQRGFLRHSQGRCDIGAFELPPSMVLWTNAADHTAQLWSLHGSSFVGMTGFAGPEAGWTAQSYSRLPDESYRLLWSANNLAQVWSLGADNGFLGVMGFLGPWQEAASATSYFRNTDGTSHLLWSADDMAQVWTLTGNGMVCCYFGLSGPGPGWTATSYFGVADGTHRVLWTTDNQAQLWTLTPTLAFGGMIGLSGPGPGWTATSYHRNGDGSWHVVWTSNNLAQIWTITPAGTFGGMMGLTGSAPGWTVQSFVN